MKVLTVVCAALALILLTPVHLSFCFEWTRTLRFAFCVQLFRFPVFMRHGVLMREAAGKYAAALYDAKDAPKKKLPLFPIAPSSKKAARSIRRIWKHPRARRALMRALKLEAVQTDVLLAGENAFFLSQVYGTLCAALFSMQAWLYAQNVKGDTRVNIRFGRGDAFFAAGCMVSTSAGKLITAAARAASMCFGADASK